MPDQSTAATEHALTQDLAQLPPADLPPDDTEEMIATASASDFPIALRGYDREAVDAYVSRTNELIESLQATRTPEGAVRRALDRVGEEVAGVLRRAHEIADQITSDSRGEADDRLRRAEREAHEITAKAVAQLRDLDADTDRIWAERQRIIEDARALAEELLTLADTAAERFPADQEAPASDATTPDEASSSADGDAFAEGDVPAVRVLRSPGATPTGDEGARGQGRAEP